MRKVYILILTFLILRVSSVHAQSETYQSLIKIADSLYRIKEYKKSTYAFSWAFRVNSYRSTLKDRYNAAKAWSMNFTPDSAFYHLLKMAKQGNFSDYDKLVNDPAFTPIHLDARWNHLVGIVKVNSDKTEANLDQTLKKQLDTIHDNLIYWHRKLDSLKHHDPKNKIAFEKLNKTVTAKDSLYKDIITDMWKSIGWVGQNVVGKKGRDAQFYLLKYVSLYTQKKYLPLFKKAVKEDFATLEQMAVIDDIMAIRQGKKQIYGTQVGLDAKGNYFLQPVEDPSKVNQLRAELGMQPLNEYLKSYGLSI
ncbi:hypothetical protein C3K47_04690 [Solitalea longa]|uniref:Tail specific protease N-terminal domain-containing protein n=1 Tax=Solitalea longa TaxID=2079460 RepID=A0A2S5A5P2_9SPHI|nr:DUF6624 domain-containing protein [Solitalea longa]POY37834.1 hypothetical protein C3K47_04690 [Solitalea longa]